MSRCIYCLQKDSHTAFSKREHVIPSALGSFQPLNPTITAQDGLVCDVCNGEIFSPLETIFIEDTYEGVYAQRLNLQGRNSVTMRNDLFKVERLSGFGDDFFDRMFLFLKPEGDKIVPELKNQIKLRRFQGGNRVFLPDPLRTIPRDSAAFKRIAADLQKLNHKDICVFGDSPESVANIAELLRSFGVDYKEKEARGHLFAPGDTLEFHEEYSCTISKEVGRVLAKIAFNYFAYCALQDGRQDMLYSSNFDALRGFACRGEGELKQFIPSFNEQPILQEERDRNKRLVWHLINFLPDDGQIVVRLTFFGLPAVYKIILGALPPEMSSAERFGCGHGFDPFSQKIASLSQVPPGEQTEDQVRITFGLLKRT